MGFLSQVMGAAKGIIPQFGAGGQALPGLLFSRPAGAYYPRELRHADFKTADIAVTAAIENEIGAYTIEAQTFGTFGQGRLGQTDLEKGRIFIDLFDSAGTRINGEIRLEIQNAQSTAKRVVLKQRTEVLRLQSLDRSKWPVLPEANVWAGEDSKLVIILVPDATGIVDYGLTVIRLPCSFYQ